MEIKRLNSTTTYWHDDLDSEDTYTLDIGKIQKPRYVNWQKLVTYDNYKTLMKNNIKYLYIFSNNANTVIKITINDNNEWVIDLTEFYSICYGVCELFTVYEKKRQKELNNLQ